MVFSKLRRRGQTVEMTAKFPINQMSRGAVDSEIDQIRHSVIPIIGADKSRRPRLVGSAVALGYRGHKFLATAKHVLDEGATTPLMFFGADQNSRPLRVGFEKSPSQDLAVMRLIDEEIAALRHVPFLAESTLARTSPVGARFYASVVGFPASGARLMDRGTIDTQMEVFSNFASEQLDGAVWVDFDKKEGADSEGKHVAPRDPTGKSGGAIFGFPGERRYVLPGSTAKLVGIASLWKREERRIEGPSVATLLPLLDRILVDRAEGS